MSQPRDRIPVQRDGFDRGLSDCITSDPRHGVGSERGAAVREDLVGEGSRHRGLLPWRNHNIAIRLFTLRVGLNVGALGEDLVDDTALKRRQRV